ncbi:MAG: lysozyme inhibitor LprI family protein [Burkholderiales bacterium]
MLLITMSAAARPVAGDDRCSQQPTTQAIVECKVADTKEWDRRLNAAYQALEERAAPAQRKPLLTAQRAWMRYRDANCRFYAAGEGTISRVLAADCLRSTTRDRACELESADNMENGAGPDCR